MAIVDRRRCMIHIACRKNKGAKGTQLKNTFGQRGQMTRKSREVWLVCGSRDMYDRFSW